MDNIVGSWIYHACIPIVITINENSLICHRDIPVKKLFFLVCLHIPKKIIVISGFMININNAHTNNGRIFCICKFAKSTCDHNNTKNMTKKKSLSGLILLVISNLYAEFANVIPAIKAPISIPNPNR